VVFSISAARCLPAHEFRSTYTIRLELGIDMCGIRILGLCLFVMFCELGVAAQAPSSTQDLQNATVKGVVLDVNEARIVGAIIKIENAEVRRRVKSDGEGSFRIELPPGEYRISAEQIGFKKFVFSPFRAKAGVCELVNIHMEVAVPKSPVKVTKPLDKFAHGLGAPLLGNRDQGSSTKLPPDIEPSQHSAQ
jgi:Carboxypeptidase regulatory-like domain